MKREEEKQFVADVQASLNQVNGKEYPIKQDGLFGPKTHRAFQQMFSELQRVKTRLNGSQADLKALQSRPKPMSRIFVFIAGVVFGAASIALFQ